MSSFGPYGLKDKPLPDAPNASDERYPIVIRRDGVWLYHGSPIQRLPLVKLFSTVLKRDDSGEYWLITPAERGRITVEDVPFIGIELQAEADKLQVRTNIEDIVTIDSEHPLQMRGGAPYIKVRGNLEARLNQASWYELAQLAVEHEGRPGVWSAGCFFPIDEVAS